MNDYIGSIVTLLVGFVALMVYQKQKRDHKKDAANILLIEIEAAERQLQIIKEGGTPKKLREDTFLMPSASWPKYRHLFARNFTVREWDIVMNFYARCKQFDEAVAYNSSFFRQDVEAYRASINSVLAQAALSCAQEMSNDAEKDDQKLYEKTDKKYLELATRIIKLYMEPKNLYTYDPQKPINDAVDAIGSLDATISTSTVGIKLRKIARPTILQRLFSKKEP